MPSRSLRRYDPYQVRRVVSNHVSRNSQPKSDTPAVGLVSLITVTGQHPQSQRRIVNSRRSPLTCGHIDLHLAAEKAFLAFMSFRRRRANSREQTSVVESPLNQLSNCGRRSGCYRGFIELDRQLLLPASEIQVSGYRRPHVRSG